MFRTRIELRQIGVREAKMLGLASAGGLLLLHLWGVPAGFHKMAKEQGLSLNPTKISGTCGG